MNDTKKLIGERIVKAKIKNIKNHDDTPYLFLTMESGIVFKIIANYGGYTGNSEDEYRRFIEVEKLNKQGKNE